MGCASWVQKRILLAYVGYRTEPPEGAGIVSGMNNLREQTDEAFRHRQAGPRSRTQELTRFNHGAVGRELRIIDLKKQVNELCQRHGEGARYPLAFEQDAKAAKAPTMPPGDSLVPLESVLCTEELNRRPTRAPDYETENRALAVLVRGLADSPRTILQTLADTLLEVFKAGSAGLSLLTKDEKSFFWPAVAGAWRAHTGGGTPATPPAEECLLVPFDVQGKAVGTIWVIAHDDRRKFDAEDLRQLESLGRFASAAYQAMESLGALEQRRAALSLMEDEVQSRQAMERANVELRASEERYRTLFESIDEGCCIIEKVEGEAGEPLDFRYVEVNPAFAAQSGMSGVVGKTIRQLAPVESEARLLTYDAVLRTGEPKRFERGLVALGRVSELYAFRVEDGAHRRVAVIFNDITGRKQMEEDLRESEVRYRRLFEAAYDGILILDAANGKITQATHS